MQFRGCVSPLGQEYIHRELQLEFLPCRYLGPLHQEGPTVEIFNIIKPKPKAITNEQIGTLPMRRALGWFQVSRLRRWRTPVFPQAANVVQVGRLTHD